MLPGCDSSSLSIHNISRSTPGHTYWSLVAISTKCIKLISMVTPTVCIRTPDCLIVLEVAKASLLSSVLMLASVMTRRTWQRQRWNLLQLQARNVNSPIWLTYSSLNTGIDNLVIYHWIFLVVVLPVCSTGGSQRSLGPEVSKFPRAESHLCDSRGPLTPPPPPPPPPLPLPLFPVSIYLKLWQLNSVFASCSNLQTAQRSPVSKIKALSVISLN